MKCCHQCPFFTSLQCTVKINVSPLVSNNSIVKKIKLNKADNEKNRNK